MRLHRFYIYDTEPLGHTINIDNNELIHQWKNVFRMKVKAQSILFGNNGIEYTCSLLSIDKKNAVWEVLSEEVGKKAPREITLCAALIKKDNFEVIIQKAVELGVTNIIPIISERSEKKFLNYERSVKIVIEAAEQCGRVDIPTIGQPVSFSNSLNALPKNSSIICFDPTGIPFDAKIFSKQNLVIYIGPEGGWAEGELLELVKHGSVMSLPTFILRAETAAIATVALASTLA